jgi:serine protease
MRSGWLRRRWLTCVLAAVSALSAAVPSAAPGAAPQASTASSPSARPQTAVAPQRFIVKLRGTGGAPERQAAPTEVHALAARHGLELLEVRHIVSGLHLMLVRPHTSVESVAQTLARLRADSRVEYAEPDQRRYPQASPDDTLFGAQWYLENGEPAAIDAVSAWNITTGSPGLVIADLDTGVRFDHPDLRGASANRLLPGYNMISNAQIANNGYGRGPDASDPGDWVSESDLKSPVFAGCQMSNSSWHGTRTAGILGAITNNAAGIAGITWEGWIEPVRVLGKCGGYDSDIIAAMAWAAGNAVEGVPDNPYPARILNMSLGAPGNCPASYQEIVDELSAQGVLVVASAGNEGGPVDAPANCAGVAGIAGVRQIGTKVGYSSLGPEVALAAPAGNCVNTGAGQPCLFSIETTTNSGTTVPATNTYTDEFHFNVGTSFSAPIVAGIAGLMLAVNGNLTAGQLIARLQEGASTPFPVSADAGVPSCHVPTSASDLQTSECSCTTDTCGAGLANANGAVLAALRPIAAIALPAHFQAGSTVPLDGSGSAAACNASIVSYRWSVVQPASHPPTIVNANGAHASVQAPAGSASYTLMLTVTDTYGRTDRAPLIVYSGSASTSAPANAGDSACLTAVAYSEPAPSGVAGGSGGSGGGGGGGGGALDLLTLMALAPGLLSSVLARRPHSSRCAASSHGRCARR